MQKFENVDILKSLKAIMQTHTEHFQSDFDIDIKTLKQAAKSPNPEDKKQLWCKSQYKNVGLGQYKNVGFPTFLYCLFSLHLL